MSTTLSIAIVSHFSNTAVLKQTIQSLKNALDFALQQNVITSVCLFYLDNSLDENYSKEVVIYLQDNWPKEFSLEVRILTKNDGFGVAHNIAIQEGNSDYHLILNPDVIVEKQAVYHAVNYMQANTSIGLITPNAVNETGKKLYLTKQYPPLIILFLRGFFPKLGRFCCAKKMDKYEMRDLDPMMENTSIRIASGCFMFFRQDFLKNSLSFCSRVLFIFLKILIYHGAFQSQHAIAYLPQVKISHFGGHSDQKRVQTYSIFYSLGDNFL